MSRPQPRRVIPTVEGAALHLLVRSLGFDQQAAVDLGLARGKIDPPAAAPGKHITPLSANACGAAEDTKPIAVAASRDCYAPALSQGADG